MTNDKFKGLTLLAINRSPDFYLHRLTPKSQGINFSDNTAIIDNMMYVNSRANPVMDNNTNIFQH